MRFSYPISRDIGFAKKLGYHIKLLGPARTVEKHKKAFDAWVKAFKK